MKASQTKITKGQHTEELIIRTHYVLSNFDSCVTRFVFKKSVKTGKEEGYTQRKVRSQLRGVIKNNFSFLCLNEILP